MFFYVIFDEESENFDHKAGKKFPTWETSIFQTHLNFKKIDFYAMFHFNFKKRFLCMETPTDFVIFFADFGFLLYFHLRNNVIAEYSNFSVYIKKKNDTIFVYTILKMSRAYSWAQIYRGVLSIYLHFFMVSQKVDIYFRPFE